MTKLVSNYLQLFEEPIVDDSTSEFEYVEYVTRDVDVDKNGQRILETQDLDMYLLPHKSYIEIRGKLVKTNGDNYDAGAQVALVNNGWALFQSAQYQVNNTTIEDVNLYMPQASTIMNLVMFSDDYSRSTSTNMMWAKDTGTGGAVSHEFEPAASMLRVADVADVTEMTGKLFRDHFSVKRNPAYNAGFAQRRAICTGDKTVCMWLPPAAIFGFCRDVQTVFRGVKHTLVLNRQTPSEYIMKAPGVDDGKFVITNLSWWIPRVIPSISIQAELESKMVSGTLKKMYFEQMRVYRSTVYLAAQTTCTWRVTTNQGSELPRHLFVAFQDNERINDQLKNNMVFDNLDLRRIQVRMNSRPYPDRELETDFRMTSRNYGRAYMMLQEAMSKYQDTDTGSQLSVEEFASLYPIIHIDVSKHPDRLKDSPADIELRWTLGSTPPRPYFVYVVATSDRYLTLEVVHGRMNIIV